MKTYGLKHSTSPVGSQNLHLLRRLLILTPRPIKRLQMSSVKWNRLAHHVHLIKYLSSVLNAVLIWIHAAWSCGVVSSEWKKACTILVHKKGETANPANFPPITLESVPLKVFTSCLRKRTFQFLAENNYIEQNVQKGFTPNLSGTLEQTAQLANIIN
jgi:hypothetical protein